MSPAWPCLFLLLLNEWFESCVKVECFLNVVVFNTYAKKKAEGAGGVACRIVLNTHNTSAALC